MSLNLTIDSKDGNFCDTDTLWQTSTLKTIETLRIQKEKGITNAVEHYLKWCESVSPDKETYEDHAIEIRSLFSNINNNIKLGML